MATPEYKAERFDVMMSGTAINTSTIAAAKLIPIDKPLTEKQQLFVRYWAQGDTPQNSMLRAGFTEGSVTMYSRLRVMPNIRRAYDIEKAKYEEASQMTRKKVMDMLQEAFDMAKLMAEPASMVSAAREIGKMCGYYEPVTKKLDITVNGKQLTKKMDQMTDEELQKMIMDGVQAVAELEMAKEEENEDE